MGNEDQEESPEEEEEEEKEQQQQDEENTNVGLRIPKKKYSAFHQRAAHPDETDQQGQMRRDNFSYELIRQEQLGAALQRGCAFQAAKTCKEQKEKDARENSVDTLDDGFAKRMTKRGLSKFERGEFVRGIIQSQYSDALEFFANKSMSLDRTLKRTDVFAKGKYDPQFFGFPRISLDGLVNYRVRKDVKRGNLTHEEAFVILLVTSVLFNKFCTFYGLSVQTEVVQRLGSVLHVKRYKGDIEVDIIEVIKDVTDSKSKLNGFEFQASRSGATTQKVVARRGGGGRSTHNAPPVKRAKRSLSPFHDKNGPQFVPKGWCIFLFGLGSCSKGAKCQHSHTRWSAAEEKAARASR